MDIMLTRVGPGDDGWQPLSFLESAYRRGVAARVAFVTASRNPAIGLGMSFPADGEPPAFIDADETLHRLHDAARTAADNRTTPIAGLDAEIFVAAVAPPPRILLLGGGPDARPVTTLGGFLGWRVTVVDHRATYLVPSRFAPGTLLIESRAADVANSVALDDYAAAVVMSHHLDSDLAYLRALASSRVPYVGLLGPAARREKLLTDLGADADKLRARLRAPVGLDIGGRAPESIALSIVGEVHAVLAGRGGRPFSEVSGAA